MEEVCGLLQIYHECQVFQLIPVIPIACISVFDGASELINIDIKLKFINNCTH